MRDPSSAFRFIPFYAAWSITYCVAALTTNTNQVFGGEPAAVDRQQRIRELVESLAMSSSWPKTEESNDTYLVFPKDFDWKRYERVGKVAEELKSFGIEAFPELVAHSNDKRFCCASHGPEIDRCESVGWACRKIMRSQIDVYPFETLGKVDHALRPLMIPDFNLPDQMSIADWWCKNQGKSLREMQILAAEYVLKETQLRKAPNAYDDSKAFEELRRRNVKHLEKFIAEQKQSKKPKPSGNLNLDIVNKHGGKENELPIYQGK